MKYEHIETGKIYEVIDKQIFFVDRKVDNICELHTIIYRDEDGKLHCRDEKKFFEKFKKIGE